MDKEFARNYSIIFKGMKLDKLYEDVYNTKCGGGGALQKQKSS